MTENKLFSFKIMKYETKFRSRPFLKLRLKEPKIEIDYSNKLRAKRLGIKEINTKF
jgi:hypothetical protein